MSEFQNTSYNFVAGKISTRINVWRSITSDERILEFVKGYSIEFVDKPFQKSIPKQIKFNDVEFQVIDEEIKESLSKGIIELVTQHTDDEYISNIFVRPKKNGKYRVILNLKHLNNFVEYHHFKMETLSAAISLVSKNCYFASIDLQDAYYSCNVCSDDRKFLRFFWNGEKYQYTCLAMGLASAPRIFTKMLKPVYSTLRKRGHANVAYIDDSLLISKTETECQRNVQETAQLLDRLGLTVNVEKSVFKPTRRIQFLGFIIDSESMTIALSDDRVLSIKGKCQDVLNQQQVTIRELAQLIGKLVSSEPGVRYAPLYYKSLEIEKDYHLKCNAGDFEAKIKISNSGKKTIEWWIYNVHMYPRSIINGNPSLIVKTDSSLSGWGAYNENNGECLQGIWSEDDLDKHINFLELKAGFIAVTTFCKEMRDCHVRLLMDNTVAVTYISKMGGKIESLNTLTISMWEFCIVRNIWLSASHIAGVENSEADFLSRNRNIDLEWMLDRDVYRQIEIKFGKCDVDLFASRLNYQFKPYVSYTPDKDATAVNALTMAWNKLMCYVFCPFSIMGTVLQKITSEEAEAVVIAPIWPTQHWFPQLLHMICENSYLLPDIPHLLTLPENPQKRHPLRKMRLGVFRVSGKPSKIEDYRRKLKPFFSHHGETQLKNSIGHILKNGCHFVTSGKLIFLKQM